MQMKEGRGYHDPSQLDYIIIVFLLASTITEYYLAYACMVQNLRGKMSMRMVSSIKVAEETEAIARAL